MAQANKQYRLSKQAEADLEDIYAFTAQTWSVRQAARYLDNVQEALEALVSGTRRGHPRPELGSDYLVLAIGSHFIIFRETVEVVVVRILHQSRDLRRHLGPDRP